MVIEQRLNIAAAAPMLLAAVHLCAFTATAVQTAVSDTSHLPPLEETRTSIAIGGSPTLIKACEVSRSWLCADFRRDVDHAAWVTPFHEVRIRVEVSADGKGGAPFVGAALPASVALEYEQQPGAAGAPGVAESWHATILMGHGKWLSELIGGPKGDPRLPSFLAETFDELLPYSWFPSTSPILCPPPSARNSGGEARGCVIARPLLQCAPCSSPKVCLRLMATTSSDGADDVILSEQHHISVSASVGISTFHIAHLIVGTALLCSARTLSSWRVTHYATGAFLAWFAGALLIVHFIWKKTVSSMPIFKHAAVPALLVLPVYPRLLLRFVAYATPVLRALLMSRVYLIGSAVVGSFSVWYFGAFLPHRRRVEEWEGGEEQTFYIAEDGSRVDRDDPEERWVRPGSQKALSASISAAGVVAFLFSTNSLPVSLAVAFVVWSRDRLGYCWRRIRMRMLSGSTPHVRPVRILSDAEYASRMTRTTLAAIEKLRDHVNSDEGAMSMARVRPDSFGRLWQFARGANHRFYEEEEEEGAEHAGASWVARLGWIAILSTCGAFLFL